MQFVNFYDKFKEKKTSVITRIGRRAPVLIIIRFILFIKNKSNYYSDVSGIAVV